MVEVAVAAPDAEVEAWFPKGKLRLFSHSSGGKGMLGVDAAAEANIRL
jgi:hypothetical protein